MPNVQKIPTNVWSKQIPRVAKSFGLLRERLQLGFGSGSIGEISFKRNPGEFKIATNFIGKVLTHAPVDSTLSLGRFGQYEARSIEEIRKLGEIFQDYDQPPVINAWIFSFRDPFFRPYFPVDEIVNIIRGRDQLYELWISNPSSLIGFDFYAEYIRGARIPTDLRFRVFDGGHLTVETGKLTRIGEFNIQLYPANPVIVCDFTPFATESQTYEAFK